MPEAPMDGPAPLPVAEQKALDAIAHFLLMGRGAYASPEDMAVGLLKRLALEGYVVRRP